MIGYLKFGQSGKIWPNLVTLQQQLGANFNVKNPTFLTIKIA